MGRDPMHIQGPSGNISIKNGDTMAIKASGTRMADAEHSDIFVEVLLPTHGASGHFVSLPNQVLSDDTSHLRPSIETALHAVMPHRFVLHTHSVHALAHVVRADTETTLAELFSVQAGVAIVDYARPGQALATIVSEALREKPNLNVVLLRNHGLVLGSETLDGLRRLLGEVDDLLCVTGTVHGGVRATPECGSSGIPVMHDTIQRLASSPAFEMLAASWPLFPDQAVFLGPTIEVADDTIRTEHFTVKKDFGVCSVRDIPRSAFEQLVCLAEVLDRQDESRPLRGIGAREADELVNWTHEIHRKQQDGAR